MMVCLKLWSSALNTKECSIFIFSHYRLGWYQVLPYLFPKTTLLLEVTQEVRSSPSWKLVLKTNADFHSNVILKSSFQEGKRRLSYTFSNSLST